MEMDMGATFMIISEKIFDDSGPNMMRTTLQKFDSKLKSYTGELIDVKGATDVEVVYNN